MSEEHHLDSTEWTFCQSRKGWYLVYDPYRIVWRLEAHFLEDQGAWRCIARAGMVDGYHEATIPGQRDEWDPPTRKCYELADDRMERGNV